MKLYLMKGHRLIVFIPWRASIITDTDVTTLRKEVVLFEGFLIILPYSVRHYTKRKLTGE